MSTKKIPEQSIYICDGCLGSLSYPNDMHRVSLNLSQSGSQFQREREMSLDFCQHCAGKIEKFIQEIPKKSLPPAQNWP